MTSVIVVGAGVVGCATAYFLANEGASVTVFDATGIAAGASGRNAGVVEHPYDAAQAPLYDETVARLTDLLGAQMPGAPVGVLLLTDDEPTAEQLATQYARFAALDPTVLAPSELAAVEPLIAPDRWACRLETGYPVRPASAATTLARLARRSGARFDVGRGVSLVRRGDRVTGLTRGDETHSADVVVVAAGAASSCLVDPSQSWQPVRASWGVSATIELARRPSHVLLEGTVASIQTGAAQAHDAAFSLIATPEHVALGSTFLAHKPAGAEWLPRLMERGRRFCPSVADAKTGAITVCARPRSFDGRPLLGRVRGVDGLWVAAGHGGRGISTGIASGRLVAEAILGNDEREIPPQLRADRLPMR
jgi:glycine/D-amino acid oxidase-like deaminating enzyme